MQTTQAARSPQPGTLVDSEVLPVELWPRHTSAAFKVTYQGIGYDGVGRLVSGSVFVPADGPSASGWPVVSYAHGTTGLANHAAPSAVGLTKLERNHVSDWLAAGYVVAATDYEGLSTPGPHPYFNGEAVADDVVDIVRAARGLDHRLSRRWLAAGFSQGGHAALFAGLMATKYAPELDFRGTIAVAPPVNVAMIMDIQTAAGSGPVTILLPFLLAGLRSTRPSFDTGRFLTDAGSRVLSLAEHGTLIDVLKATAPVTNDDLGTTNICTHREVAEALVSCRVPVTRMDRPVLVTAGGADEVVPREVVERFVSVVRETGSNIHYFTYDDATHCEMLSAGNRHLTLWARSVLDGGESRRPTRFSLFDATGDGYLTLDDYEAFALRLVQAMGKPPGAAAARAVREGYRTLWRAVAAGADTNQDGRVSEAEFTAWIDAQAGVGGGLDRAIIPLARAVIALTDTDGDDQLDEHELVRLLTGCELPLSEARRVFARLDTDHDGHVCADEVVDAVRQFCLDPGRGQPGYWLFGRI